MNMKVGGWNINYFFYLVGHESSLMLQASCGGKEYLVLPGIEIIWLERDLRGKMIRTFFLRYFETKKGGLNGYGCVN